MPEVTDISKEVNKARESAKELLKKSNSFFLINFNTNDTADLVFVRLNPNQVHYLNTLTTKMALEKIR